MPHQTARQRIMGKKFKEGEFYPFTVGNRLSIEEGEDFLALTDPWGKKHLLPFSRFRKYKLEKGQTLYLKVDKINCQGKVFFEPPHPCHSEGDITPFKINRTRTHINSFGETEWIAVVEDCLGFEAELPVKREILENKVAHVNCRIEKIENGQVFLVPDFLEFRGTAHSGQILEFSIERVLTFAEREFFMLSNSENQNFRLRVKYCKGLGFRPGIRIRCLIRQYPNGILFPDPIHPLFEINSVQVFDIITDSQMVNSEGDLVPALEVRDQLGNKHLVAIPQGMQKIPTEGLVHCRILSFSKGKLELDFEKLG